MVTPTGQSPKAAKTPNVRRKTASIARRYIYDRRRDEISLNEVERIRV